MEGNRPISQPRTGKYKLVLCVCPGRTRESAFDLVALGSGILPLVWQQLVFIKTDAGIFSKLELLMRDLISKSKTALADVSNMGTMKADIEKRTIALVTDDICSALLDASFQRMLKKEKVGSGITQAVGTLELWSDDFDSKIDFSQYRSRLSVDERSYIGGYCALLKGSRTSG
ncbi:hypothetical protein OROGR_010564 [Orobanche gracilis]